MLVLSVAAAGASREVAITIDDLPRGGDGGGGSFAEIRTMTQRLLTPFGERKIPVTGFVHPGRTELSARDLRRILDLWMDAGAELGNHTWSHADLNRTAVADYEREILKADAVLRPVVEERGKKLEFFRYPMLHAGPTAEVKQSIAEFLAVHHYRNAPVTLDNSDYMFAALYTRPEFRARAMQEYVPYLESVVAFFERRSVVSANHAAAFERAELPDHAGYFGHVPATRLPVRGAGRGVGGRCLPAAGKLCGPRRILLDPPLVDDQRHAEQRRAG
jgi:peptidoglycan/xylan/chitin deacetylase (PgdA/CDA1 family)